MKNWSYRFNKFLGYYEMMKWFIFENENRNEDSIMAHWAINVFLFLFGNESND